ncbi:MAG: DUF86 domain-containing protein [Epsilonproteobacteria bacterium]|jgi:uncharacterized protein YutE (UPF0331/DUF86 family)|nr:DUF86 domain-containing protein [Campylobacterota bacterium]
MDEKRLKRYIEKINVIEKRRGNIFSWISEKDEKSVLAVYKAFQEVVESFTDLCAMLLKDMKEIVEDDYTNIENLRKIDFFTEKQEAMLKEANGLRNRLIHEYNGLEQKTALYSIQEINDEMDSILEKVRIWVKKS